MENCNRSFVLSPFLEKTMVKEGRGRWNIAFSCYIEGLGAGRVSIESLKFVDPSGLTLPGVVTIEVHVRLGCRYQVIHFSFFVGVNTDALDRIAFRVGVIYLLQRLLRWLFMRELFVGVGFCLFMGAWMLSLMFILLLGLRCFLPLP